MEGRMLRLRWFAGCLGLVLATAVGCTARKPEACESQIRGGLLLARLLDISLTADELQHLNGEEQPKLKRHLEWRLVSAIAAARRHVDEGATVERNVAVPNLKRGVEQAAAYITAHDLDNKPPVPEDK